MASHLSILAVLIISLSSAAARPPPAALDQACRATRFTDICLRTLTSGPAADLVNPTALQILDAAISVPTANLEKVQDQLRTTLDTSAGNLNRTNIARNCLEMLEGSAYRAGLAAEALRSGAGDGVVHDAVAWMSGAVHFQYASWSALSYVNDTAQVVETMALLNDTLSQSSNALSMVAALGAYGDDTSAWAPLKTERDGFWGRPRGGSPAGPVTGGVPRGLSVSATVGKGNPGGGGGRVFETIQQAVDAAPSDGKEKFVVLIKAGVYSGTVRVPLHKTNLVFIGEGAGKTVITGSSAIGAGVTTYNTATLGVMGDGFRMSGVTVQNTAGSDAQQAVAFRSSSDRSVVEECEFLGNQDTLHVDAMRQFYRSCRIEGNVDFIFGNAAAVFHNCTVLVRPRQGRPEASEKNVVSANGRVDPAQATGIVFDGCSIDGTREYMGLQAANPKAHRGFLGRPWKEYARTVFINCSLGPMIDPEGWLPWKEDFALQTLFCGEFGNSGAGANPAGRVPWSSRIPAEHVGAYAVEAFIQGDRWIPSPSSAS